VGAVAAGVLGGVLAFGVANPTITAIADGHDGDIRALASDVSAALVAFESAGRAADEGAPAAPVEIEIEDAEAAAESPPPSSEPGETEGEVTARPSPAPSTAATAGGSRSSPSATPPPASAAAPAKAAPSAPRGPFRRFNH
jgi:hypothetical protein